MTERPHLDEDEEEVKGTGDILLLKLMVGTQLFISLFHMYLVYVLNTAQ